MNVLVAHLLGDERRIQIPVVPTTDEELLIAREKVRVVCGLETRYRVPDHMRIADFEL